MGINSLRLIGRIRDKSRDFILFSIISGLFADTNYQLLIFNSFDDYNVLLRCFLFVRLTWIHRCVTNKLAVISNRLSSVQCSLNATVQLQ